MPPPTPHPPGSPLPLLLRALLGLLLTAVLTALGLLVGLALIGPCPRIEPRWLLPFVAFGPAVLGLTLGLATTLLLTLRGRSRPQKPAS
ncbi:MAG: hypothetical protein IPJ77_00970 [Planctomycetes bacterium]|nr:hypothetical protein [Planctomycetota bacterium]